MEVLPTVRLPVPARSPEHGGGRLESRPPSSPPTDGAPTLAYDDARQLVLRKILGGKPGGSKMRQTGWKKFLAFRDDHNLPDLAPDDCPLRVGRQLLWFSAYLYVHSTLRGSTIATYLSNAKTRAGYAIGRRVESPEEQTLFLTRIRAEDGSPNARAACTPRLARETSNVAASADVAFKASVLLLWYGTRRVSFATHKNKSEGTDWELTWDGIRFATDDSTGRQVALVHYKRSKAQMYNQGGVQTFFSLPGSEYCPVDALKQLHEQCRRRGQAGRGDPVFRRADGKLVTAKCISSLIKTAARNLGLNPKRYGTHSFRIGSASAAFDRGVSLSELKVHGLWASDAFLDYVRTSPCRASNMSDALNLDRADHLDSELRALWEEFIREHQRAVRRS